MPPLPVLRSASSQASLAPLMSPGQEAGQGWEKGPEGSPRYILMGRRMPVAGHSSAGPTEERALPGSGCAQRLREPKAGSPTGI